MKTGLCVLLLTLAACAGSPPKESTSADQQYREDDARIRAMEEYAQMRASCARSGGMVVVRRSWGSRLLEPPLNDAGAATCVY